jgi:hypothetical protein
VRKWISVGMRRRTCNADGVSREDAKTRRVGIEFRSCPRRFVAMRGVLECSGLTELWMGIERVDGKIQSGVKPPQSKKQGSGLNF